MKMNSTTAWNIWKSDGLLLTAAGIWGFAFVAQRAGMAHVGPFVFNGIRFALGSAVLLPFVLFTRKTSAAGSAEPVTRKVFGVGLLAGSVLFFASAFQQVGIVYTTAGKAGFITGLYVIMVPLLGLLRRQHILRGTWAGAVLATVGMYLLSNAGGFSLSRGDLLVFVGAVFWAVHVHLLGWLSPKMDSYKLSALQYALCSLLSLSVAVVFESFSAAGILAAALPILYGGIFSVGIAFTLQVIAQRKANPAHVVIILSLEGVFAVFGGWLILGEVLTTQALVGCALMFAGMVIAQLAILWYVRKEQ